MKPNIKRNGLLLSVATVLLILSGAGWLIQTPTTSAATGEQQSRPPVLEPHGTSHPVPAIDGALQPDLISDDVALSLFSRAATPRVGDESARQSRAYLRYMLSRFGDSSIDRDETANRALTVVREFKPKLDGIDAQLREAGEARDEVNIAILKEHRIKLSANLRRVWLTNWGPSGDAQVHGTAESETAHANVPACGSITAS